MLYILILLYILGLLVAKLQSSYDPWLWDKLKEQWWFNPFIHILVLLNGICSALCCGGV